MTDIVCSGALFYSTNTKRFLLVHRNEGKNSVWGIVGGKSEEQERPYQSLLREIEEEIGFIPKIRKAIPLELFTSNDGKFFYHTYVLLVDDEFIPKLNNEHDGYSWVSKDRWPKPLHQGVRKTLNNSIIKEKLMVMIDLIGQ
jgi:8-oxo-dGTP pyrophosphatase MutT (NUDIX family)